MNPETLAAIRAQIEAGKAQMPMMQPAQAVALVVVLSTLRKALDEANIILPAGTSEEPSAEADLRESMEHLSEFVREVQISTATMTDWSAL